MSTELTRDNGNPAALAGFESETRSLTSKEVGAVSAAAREEAEIKTAIFLARQFPRSEHTSYNRVIKSCKRPGFAEDALYKFPRGGQTISGSSVNMAREIARCWGNIRYGLRVVSVDAETVHIRGYAHDLETNAYVEHEDKFAKLVQRKRGGRTEWVPPDERDLRELVNRRGAILVRNAILQVVPSDVVDAAEGEAKTTLIRAAKGEIEQSLDDAIRRLVMAFDGVGVNAQVLTEYLKHPLEAITADEIADLRAVYKSIVDGNTRRDEHFDLNAGAKVRTESNAELNARLEEEPSAGEETKSTAAPKKPEGQKPAEKSGNSNGRSAGKSGQQKQMDW